MHAGALPGKQKTFLAAASLYKTSLILIFFLLLFFSTKMLIRSFWMALKEAQRRSDWPHSSFQNFSAVFQSWPMQPSTHSLICVRMRTYLWVHHHVRDLHVVAVKPENKSWHCWFIFPGFLIIDQKAGYQRTAPFRIRREFTQSRRHPHTAAADRSVLHLLRPWFLGSVKFLHFWIN